jgi:pyrimidine-nucleoside phosphorylase
MRQGNGGRAGGVDVLEILERKKRGEGLTPEEIVYLIEGFTREEIPAYQMAAFLMAVWFRGLDIAETVALTRAMLESGAQLDLSTLTGPTADKHSTGGVGDKVSLLLAPLAAACGLKVPMLSGRGLGHTGGTLDKLEAIPGYRLQLRNDEFLSIVEEVGCAIVGQSKDIAPADGRIYALRDVTATVDCVSLITASILSKKLAAGPRTIVIDLKTGSGAFMPDLADARRLARALLETGSRWDRRMAVVFSDMSQPLGRAVGHAVETIEAFAALRPQGRAAAPPDLVQLTEELAAEMIRVAGLCSDLASARELVRERWEGGEGWTRLQAWVAAQGGHLELDRDDFGLVVAPSAGEVTAERDGYVEAIACREIGRALGDLGGARRRVEDRLDLTAGIDFRVAVGEAVQTGQPLATLYCADPQRAAAATRRIRTAVTLGDQPASAPPLVLDRLGPAGS